MKRKSLATRNLNFIKNLVIIYLLVVSLIFSMFTTSFITDTVSADSNSYYVSNDGSDSNDGLSPAASWKTIAKVNAKLNDGTIKKGDDIYFKRGDTFSGELNLKIGGTSSNYMIIGAYDSGDRPIIDNSGIGSGNCIILWTVTSGYYSIQDLHLTNASGNHEGISIMGDTYNKDFNDIIIKNIYGDNIGDCLIFMMNTLNYTIENCEGNGCSICIYGDLDNRQSNGRVLNCTVYDTVDDGITIHRANSDTTNDDTGSNHLFYNCTAYNCGEDSFDITAGQNVIFDSCEGWNSISAIFAIGHDIENVTIQNCYIHDSQSSGIQIGDFSNVIIRNNIVWNTTDYSALGIAVTNNAHGWADEDGYMENCTIYNNNFIYPSTFDGSFTNRVISIDYDFFSDTILKNNIFASFNSVQPERLYRVYGSGIIIPPDDDVTFDTNMWWHGSGSSTSKWSTGGATLNLAGWNDYYPNDVFDDPEFKNVETGDLTLNATSPCIDAGDWLTFTVGSGTGTTITLDDASYFMDGYGMIEGDTIFIGDTNNLEITNVNYDTNQITVDRSITWIDNENVSLSSYSGDKPDIGAIEFTQNEQAPDWDINEDGQCSILDYILISNHYGETGQNGWIREDVDNNGEINILDLVLVSNHYGETW